ncbi:MAG: HDIG domain-containing metalloprotein [Desulfonatronovibrio sp.]
MSFKPAYYPYDPDWNIPSREECFRYWDEYGLPDHIREHSRLVAVVAEAVCLLAEDELPVPAEAVIASALLHDLGKFYCIEHGGFHNQLGASLAMELTGNPAIAQGVMHHVFWPGDIDINRFFLPLVIIYSDKRVKHDQIVSLETRFADLFSRYGVNEKMKGLIEQSWNQAISIQDSINQKFGTDLNAYTFDSRRMV